MSAARDELNQAGASYAITRRAVQFSALQYSPVLCSLPLCIVQTDHHLSRTPFAVRRPLSRGMQLVDTKSSTPPYSHHQQK